jgi:hypothetical protein
MSKGKKILFSYDGPCGKKAFFVPFVPFFPKMHKVT